MDMKQIRKVYRHTFKALDTFTTTRDDHGREVTKRTKRGKLMADRPSLRAWLRGRSGCLIAQPVIGKIAKIVGA